MNSALTASPAIIESVVSPGKTTALQLTIQNNTNFPLPIKAQADSFISKTKLPKNLTSTFDSKSWFIIEPADFILQPQEKKNISVSITPPENSEAGGHYSTIYFEPLIPQEVMTYNSNLSLGRIGVLSFLIVPGDIQENIEITGLSTQFFSAFGPLKFELTLSNYGNVHLLPTGKILIKNSLTGSDLGSTNLDLKTIIPKESETYHLSLDKTFLFGKYSATTAIDYGTNHQTLATEPIYFWVIPWPFILVIAMLLTLLYIIFIVYIDRIKLAIKVLRQGKL